MPNYSGLHSKIRRLRLEGKSYLQIIKELEFQGIEDIIHIERSYIGSEGVAEIRKIYAKELNIEFNIDEINKQITELEDIKRQHLEVVSELNQDIARLKAKLMRK